MLRSIFILFLMVSTYSNLISAEQRDPVDLATTKYQYLNLDVLKKSNKLSFHIISAIPIISTIPKLEGHLLRKSTVTKNAFNKFHSKSLWKTTDRTLIKDLHHIVVRLGLSSPGCNLFGDNNKTILITNLLYDTFVHPATKRPGTSLDQKAYFSSIKKGIIDSKNPYSLKQMFLCHDNKFAADYTDELYLRIAPRIIKGYQSASEQPLIVI